MAMNSWDEDALFTEWGWFKDLIKRRYESPSGAFITFDQVMEISTSPEGEQALVATVRQYGERQT